MSNNEDSAVTLMAADSSGDTDFTIDTTDAGSITIGSANVDVINITTDGSGLSVTGDILPATAGDEDLGSASYEWDELYIGDDNGIKLGDGQDATLAYDESGEDRVELTGTGATLYVEDQLALGKHSVTTSNGGVDNTDVTPEASYIEVTFTDATDTITLQTGSAAEGDLLVIVNVDSNAGDVVQNATTKLEGGANVTLSQYDSIMLIFDGTNWIEVSSSTTNS